MSFNRILENTNKLKIKKVRGESCWKVYYLTYDMRREYIAEFYSKEDADLYVFVMKRAASNY